MKWNPDTRTLTISERNARSLLNKLQRPESLRTLEREGIFLTIESDEVHYANRQPGIVHPLDDPTRR